MQSELTADSIIAITCKNKQHYGDETWIMRTTRGDITIYRAISKIRPVWHLSNYRPVKYAAHLEKLRAEYQNSR